MSIRRILTSALLTIVLVAGASSAAAQQQPENLDVEKVLAEIRPYKHDFFIKKLKLTKEQASEYLPLYDQMEDELMSINQEIRELERTVLENPSATDEEIEAAARATFEQKQREAQTEMAYFEKFSNILTPRQLLKIKSVEKQFTQRLARTHRKMRRNRD